MKMSNAAEMTPSDRGSARHLEVRFLGKCHIYVSFEGTYPSYMQQETRTGAAVAGVMFHIPTSDLFQKRSVRDQSHDAYGVFCDLSKAFDCVQHQTLIRKLHHYGIRGTALDFVTSYLSGRTQSVVINDKRSPGSLVTMGAPQGSILGPFLFLVYINDLPHLVRDDHEIVLFADDTSILFKVKRGQNSLDDVNRALSKIIHWFNVNNLLLNESKTKCVRFTLPNVKLATTSIRIRDKEIELVDQAVFLGITLDSKLQWGPHIGKLSGRLSSAAYAVKKNTPVDGYQNRAISIFQLFPQHRNCIRMYNTLPGNVQDLSLNKFKHFIKSKLCSKTYYSIKDFLNDKAAWQ
ncbi:unnamed protein product [Euphydryas editha]|uniref:Reverse transcriptase domain-containing protein n=1 Tax=Euphydryas editha TaxID=104508 RepID=A0AAU9UCD2_EUPED|nr:unnamed protein product [Euphydryas editha]